MCASSQWSDVITLISPVTNSSHSDPRKTTGPVYMEIMINAVKYYLLAVNYERVRGGRKQYLKMLIQWRLKNSKKSSCLDQSTVNWIMARLTGPRYGTVNWTKVLYLLTGPNTVNWTKLLLIWPRCCELDQGTVNRTKVLLTFLMITHLIRVWYVILLSIPVINLWTCTNMQTFGTNCRLGFGFS
jgi:hypothetical protein